MRERILLAMVVAWIVAYVWMYRTNEKFQKFIDWVNGEDDYA